MSKKTKKIISLFLLIIIALSCKKTNDLESNDNKSNNYNSNQETEIATNRKNEDSAYVINGIYYNSKKEEIFYYNKMHLQPKGLKGKWIKTNAVVSFQGENRNTLILELTTFNHKNLRGTYLMNCYIGKSNDLEIFKYEKIEGDNEEEYFTFSFGDDNKLTITNLSNGDIFIFANKL